MATYIVAVTGASGAVYGIRLVSELLKGGDEVELLISPSGFLLLEEELGLKFKKGAASEAVAKGFCDYLKKDGVSVKGRLRYTPSDDLTSSLASGGAFGKVSAMVICPCSMGALGRISAGISGNLIERAADCALKERARLVIVPRETPLNDIHLENMLKLSRMGAIILPAMPAFYTKPGTIDDMVCFVVGKALDVLHVRHGLYKKWKKDQR